MYPRLRGVWAILASALCGLLVSGTMEAVQTYLPSRVPSNLDFITNAAGCLLGACIGAVARAPTSTRAACTSCASAGSRRTPARAWCCWRCGRWRRSTRRATCSATASCCRSFPSGFPAWLDIEIDLVALLRPGAAMSPEQYWLSETIITACGMAGAVLTMLCLLKKRRPAQRADHRDDGAALVVKALSSSLLFTPDNAFVWMTPGAQGGFLIGLIMLSGLAFAPQVAQRRLAIVTLVLSLLVVNTIPVNPYFVATLQGWVQGKFLNFNGAAQFLSLLWPFFALWF
jgi:hypothetical protein